MKYYSKILLFVLAISTPFTAYASFVCTGKLSVVSVNAAGHLTVNNGYGNFKACDIDAGPNEGPNSNTDTIVHSSTCQAWYAQLLIAKNNGDTVQISFDGTGTCEGLILENWHWPTNRIFFFK